MEIRSSVVAYLAIIFFSIAVVLACSACEPVDLKGKGDTFIFLLDADGDCVVRGNAVDVCEGLADEGQRVACLAELDKQIGRCGQGLRVNDCNDADRTVFPGAPELCDGQDNQCPGDTGYGQIDEGLVGCVWCDDRDACTTDALQAPRMCSHTPVAGCCNANSDCSGGNVCTSSTATVAGTCVQCTTNAHCDDGLFCNGRESCGAANRCQFVPGGACSTGLTCDEANDRCVGCLSDSDCAGSERCNTTTHACEPLSCNDNDVCTTDSASMHQCVHIPIAGCCHGPNADAECVSSRPSNLPAGYLWGCSGAQVPPTNLYYCTSCRDADGDGYCGTDEVCGNRLDDDGDGLVDESPQCVSPDAGVSDSGMPDTGTPDSGTTDAGVMDAGASGCMAQQTCQSGYYWACNRCAPYTDQHGRTPYGQSGANAGPNGDGTADSWDNDGDGYCEVSPCLGSANPSLAVSSLLGGDCDDDPSDGGQFTVNTPQGSFVTDGSYGNHPGAQEWCEPLPGFDNDCDGVPNDGCP